MRTPISPPVIEIPVTSAVQGTHPFPTPSLFGSAHFIPKPFLYALQSTSTPSLTLLINSKFSACCTFLHFGRLEWVITLTLVCSFSYSSSDKSSEQASL